MANDPNDRNEELKRLLLRGLTFLAAFVVVIAVITFIAVKALHLNADTGGESNPNYTPSPLPSRALHHGHNAGLPYDQTAKPHPHKKKSKSGTGAKGLHLSASPTTTAPMHRISLTGTYKGHDSIDLQVQRWENGAWADFPVSAQVSVGTFQTWVESSQPGANRFRVFDPTNHKGSNIVSVTIQ